MMKKVNRPRNTRDDDVSYGKPLIGIRSFVDDIGQ